MKKILTVLASMWLVGCATKNHVSPETMQVATAPLVCTNAGECTRWWSRAHDWVARHSVYALQTSTDSLIATTGPDGGSAELAYQITRTPNADGSATIGFSAHCDSMLGCRPDPWKAGADFKRFVKTGVEPPAQATTGTSPPQ